MNKQVILYQLMDTQEWSNDFQEHREFGSFILSRKLDHDEEMRIFDIVEDIKITIDEWDYDIIYDEIYDYLNTLGILYDHNREKLNVL